MERYVRTVLGDVDPAVLGKTLMHEHLLVDAKPLGVPAPYFAPKDIDVAPWTFDRLSDIRLFPYSHADNLMCDDKDEMLQELSLFRAAGGGCIVDVTTRGIRIPDSGKPPAEHLRDLSKMSDVHIVAGAGYYIGKTHPAHLQDMSVEDIAETIIEEVEVGIGGTNVRAGIIGEIGCSIDLTPTEIKVLKASAIAQAHTKQSIMIHPGRQEKCPFEIISVLKESEADLSRVAIAHIDRTLFKPESLTALAETGVHVELDMWGQETSFYQLNEECFMRNDEQRIGMVQQLISVGSLERILLSHDIHTKHRISRYGGHGFSYLFKYITPRLLKRGLTAEQIDQIFITNPAKLLSIPKSD